MVKPILDSFMPLPNILNQKTKVGRSILFFDTFIYYLPLISRINSHVMCKHVMSVELWSWFILFSYHLNVLNFQVVARKNTWLYTIHAPFHYSSWLGLQIRPGLKVLLTWFSWSLCILFLFRPPPFIQIIIIFLFKK